MTGRCAAGCLLLLLLYSCAFWEKWRNFFFKVFSWNTHDTGVDPAAPQTSTVFLGRPGYGPCHLEMPISADIAEKSDWRSSRVRLEASENRLLFNCNHFEGLQTRIVRDCNQVMIWVISDSSHKLMTLDSDSLFKNCHRESVVSHDYWLVSSLDTESQNLCLSFKHKFSLAHSSQYVLAVIEEFFSERWRPLGEVWSDRLLHVLCHDAVEEVAVDDSLSYVQVQLWARFGEAGDQFNTIVPKKLGRLG